MPVIPLNKLEPGEEAAVVNLTEEDESVRKRLEDLGLIPGTRIRCLFRSPLKDPAAYEIRGTVIALRKEDSAAVLAEPEPQPDSSMTIALAGNPNVGKSTVFNTLTGLHQHTGNWAGKTVDSAEGRWKFDTGDGIHRKTRTIRLVDIPGCYSLDARSAEEEVSRDYLQSGECSGVIVICDGTCLERNLILVQQVISLMGKKRTAVCVNMMDQVRKRELKLDLCRLSELLGVPVCATESGHPKEMRRQLEQLMQKWPEDTSSGGTREDNMQDPIALVRRAEIIAEQVTDRTCERPDISRTIDQVLTRPLAGFTAMAMLLFTVFWITIRGANYPSAILSSLLFSLEQPFYDLLYSGLGLPDLFCEMMAFGMYRVLAWVVSVMLPPMAIFFPLFTLLEDWGFLPRIAFNLDRCFQGCQACGKQALTMCMGFGCNASAVAGCRIIDSRRERLIAMITNSLVPCNGRFPLLICLIGLFFAGGQEGSLAAALMLTGVILTGVAATLLLSKILSHTVLRGIPSSFTLELPPFRKPQIGKVIIRSVLDRTLFVLARAAAAAAPAGMIIWILANIHIGGGSLLSAAAEFLNGPARLIGMDGTILLSFLLALPASEIVLPVMMMIYLNQTSLMEIGDMQFFHSLLLENGWTRLTALNVMLFSLMHWPCATTLLTIRRESGSWKWTAAAALAPLALGVIFCGITTAIACKI